jgi:creatinine amidohydrolase
LSGLAENVLRHGFKRVVFLNGHGGNDVPGRQAVFELRQRHRDTDGLLLLFATYWSLGGRPFDRPVPGGWVQQEMGHACEWETSMMLRLDPAKVGAFAGLSSVDPVPPFHPAHRAWVTRERTPSGHIGHPQAASAEKGEVLFEVFSSDVIGLLEQVRRWDGLSWRETPRQG